MDNDPLSWQITDEENCRGRSEDNGEILGDVFDEDDEEEEGRAWEEEDDKTAGGPSMLRDDFADESSKKRLNKGYNLGSRNVNDSPCRIQ